MENINMEISILAPLDLIWECFTEKKHIQKWYFSSDQWQCTKADNDFKVGGNFNFRIEAKNHKFGYNFIGVYDEIIPNKMIRIHVSDGRMVVVEFVQMEGDMVNMIQSFEPEKGTPRGTQRETAYGILNNFHKYVENTKVNS